MSYNKKQFEYLKELYYYPKDNMDISLTIRTDSLTAAGASWLLHSEVFLIEIIENKNNEFSNEDIKIAKEILNRFNNAFHEK